MKLLAANSNRTLAQAIGDYLDIPLTKARVQRFLDNEIFVTIDENVRGEDVFVIQSTSYPANDNLMELLICIDALTRASAKRITAVIPYFGYARQDRKTGGRTPISAKLVANLVTRAGAHRVLTMDLHAGQIQGFFDIPTDNLVAIPFMAKDIKANYPDPHELMIVSPDVGGVVRARALADRLNVDLAIVDKRRPRPGESEVMNIIGDVTGRRCILFDDIVDSAGTLCHAAKALMDRGAKAVSAYVSHGVLSGPALGRVADSVLSELVITDSIEATEAIRANAKIRIVGVAPLIGEAIRRIANEESVSKLFD
ncbi:ribose-phosphate pyrophosphokinase [Asticcacaulis solisilvae]|uniref:ribose-phosphate pyrophosphokinase n=1 Tax=Asticcacaulis solisilvae TaxID=1217274 RepID=UPI003FD74CE3